MDDMMVESDLKEWKTDEMGDDYERIAESIHFLEQNYLQHPSLDEIAARLHLSPAHFQRIFRRWAGISPKRFVQYLTLEHAKQQLADSRSVLDTAYDAGLSGPGRLHDLFVNLEAVTPGEYKSKGKGIVIDYGFHRTPFGECLLATTERGICLLTFLDAGGGNLTRYGRDGAMSMLTTQWSGARLVENSSKTEPLVDQVFPHSPSTGQRSVDLLVRGSNFQIRVWEALLRMPLGTICSYGALAQRIGKPGGARAVGRAVASNSVAYVIPCHRVIRQSGVVSDYRWGSTRKKAMVAWEAAHQSNLLS
jgi:AraC family transcriptional regulator of adaptative response/methylated-DNA-[protein]-cysteine methyltransferase